MSDSDRARGGQRRTQLESCTNWPLVAGAAACVLAIGGGLFALRLCERVDDEPVTVGASEEQPPPVPTYLAARPAPLSLPTRQEPAAPRIQDEQERPSVVRLARKSPEPHRTLTKPRSLDEAVLAAKLAVQARDLDLEYEEGTGEKLWRASVAHEENVRRLSRDRIPLPLSDTMADLLTERADLRGLPLLAGNACQTGKEQAGVLARMSSQVRRMQNSLGLSKEEEADLCEWLVTLGRVLVGRDNGVLYVRPLEQMLQCDTPLVRCGLVKTLAMVKGKEAAQAIARRAVFDPCRLVRETAVDALQKRESHEAREVFLSAMRHPWAPAADHAALALVALEDVEAVPALRALHEQRDPCTPFEDKDGTWKKTELVRVNHLRNCLLCHPPSTSGRDDLRGPVPVPGEPLPRVYSGTRRGRAVRADVVFFRQDFSAMHRTTSKNWPDQQRFDYLVRMRELDAHEVKALPKQARTNRTYPQREAVRWALSMLAPDEGLKRSR